VDETMLERKNDNRAATVEKKIKEIGD
jgi:hypothetical protein